MNPVQERPRILLVDDKVKNLQALEVILSGLELDCIKASSGNEALKIAMKQVLALILLDVQMPEMDGYETAVILRSLEQTQHIPIIFVTATYQAQNQIFQGYKSGAVDYLLKPLDPQILKSKISVFIEIYKKNQALEQTIQELRLSQRCMVNILDVAENAIITVNAQRQINFFNQRAENLLGYCAEEILGQSLDLLICPEDIPSPIAFITTASVGTMSKASEPATVRITVRHKNQTPQLVEASFFDINLEEETHRVLIFNTIRSQQSIGALPPALHFRGFDTAKESLPPILNSNDLHNLQPERRRIQALGEAFEGTIQFLIEGGQALIQELRSVDEVIHGINDSLVVEHHTDEYLEQLVQTMSLSIDYWKIATGKTKIELAEESGIWKVHLDKSTFRAKTMDRYLSLDTLPKKPRWKEVLATAEYVLTHCPSPPSTAGSSLYTVLKLARLKLKKLHHVHV